MEEIRQLKIDMVQMDLTRTQSYFLIDAGVENTYIFVHMHVTYKHSNALYSCMSSVEYLHINTDVAKSIGTLIIF